MVYKPLHENQDTKWIQLACSHTSYRILMALESFKSLSYTEILVLVWGKNKKGSFISHHIRHLTENNILMNNKVLHKITLTRRGVNLLKFIKANKTQFITENKEEICTNGKDVTHHYMNVCRDCFHVKTEEVKN